MTDQRGFSLLLVTGLVACGSTGAPGETNRNAGGGGGATDHARAERPLLDEFRRGPMAGVDRVVFAARAIGEDPHWYANFGYWSSDPDKKMYPRGGRLCVLDLDTGDVTAIVDDAEGSVRDPHVHHDGERVVFSYRKGGEDEYHLWEVHADGSQLRQLTDGPFDDIEAVYLPGGDLVFGSSRSMRFVNCWHTRVATLYRCSGDGTGIRMLSSNNDHDNTPWVLPDGRILYMRWEYVDRSQVHYHHLWTISPDGTAQMVYYGNQEPGVVMLDAKPVPGTDKVVASFSPGHGRKEHMGYVTIVDPTLGPDDPRGVRRVSQGAPNWRDPYAFSADCFLVADARGIHVMDGSGRTELIYRLPGSDAPLECHEPRPLQPRPRERSVPSRARPERATGQFVLEDIYDGRNMDSVEPGDIKKLLVLEQLPEPVHFSGGMEPLTIGGTFTLARVLGTVPVDPDGSASFEAPALRSLFFVALDENDLAVKRMQSFVTVQPGEVSGCVGCHEHRTRAPRSQRRLAALSRPPSRIEPIADVPDVLDFPRDIQPILDRRCLPCHDADHREGGVELTGDMTPMYTVSYWTIRRFDLVADGRNRPVSNLAPRSIGSAASRLMQLVDGSHHDVRLTPVELRTLRLWIDTSATYPGTYSAFGSGMYAVNYPGAVLQRCTPCHGPKGGATDFAGERGLDATCNLSRPEKSLLLRAPLARSAGGLGLCKDEVFHDADDPGHVRLLAAITEAAAQLREWKRFSMAGFRPNEHYIREMQRFGILPQDLGPADPIDPYATDRAYWESFWYRPESTLSNPHQKNAASSGHGHPDAVPVPARLEQPPR